MNGRINNPRIQMCSSNYHYINHSYCYSRCVYTMHHHWIPQLQVAVTCMKDVWSNKNCTIIPFFSWHIRDKLWPMREHGSMLLYVHGNHEASSLGRGAQDGPSILTQLLNYDHYPFFFFRWCLMPSDVGWHIRDKLRPMPKHGSIQLYVRGNQKSR